MKLSKIVYIALAVLSLTACGKKKVEAPAPVEVKEDSPDHKWYYFNSGSYTETDLPQHSPILSLKPWTESIRICDGNVNADGKGILLVNHFGIMLFEENPEPKLVQDYHLFSESTAGNLIFENSIPFFTLAKNSFFNKKAAGVRAVKNNDETSHVVRLNLESSMFLPAVTYGDLKLEDSAEVSGTYCDGKNWYTSIKRTENERTYFRYIKWNPIGNLSDLPPAAISGKVMISDISEDIYRRTNSPKLFSKAPGRLKDLLVSIPKDLQFNLTLHEFDGASPRYFYNGSTENGSADTETAATAIITPEWVCAIFGDGTAYFKGSLKGRPLANKGKAAAVRLPKLPENYVYGDFCISGDYLAISWEENDFYKTGRSGFLTVNMAKLFYED
ncbi:MAG: hypothetical protein KBT11_08090 [Treponema sp.]|nr:hypothetical protein [Candidatus Treponema equifaecale]